MGNVTFNNVDLLDSRSVEQAVGILWAAHRHAKQSVEIFGEKEAEVSERFSRDRTFTLLNPDTETSFEEDGTEVLSPPPTRIHAQGFYRGNSRELVETMNSRIGKYGSTTLGEVAQEMGITLDTARAFLRNAGRTNNSHKTDFPFTAKWNHERGCNEYFPL